MLNLLVRGATVAGVYIVVPRSNKQTTRVKTLQIAAGPSTTHTLRSLVSSPAPNVPLLVCICNAQPTPTQFTRAWVSFPAHQERLLFRLQIQRANKHAHSAASFVPPQVMSIKTRAGRPPGLDRQSCHCVTLLQRLCLDSQQAKRLVRNSSAQLLSWGARASRRAEKTGTRTYIQYCPRTWPVHLLDVPSGNHGVTRLGNPGAVQE